MDYNVREVSTTEFRDDKLTGQKFADEKFLHHRFFSRQISRCEYSRCRFDDLRMWDSLIADTLFDACDFRSAALGGIFEGRNNRFHRVIFQKTDLRRSAWQSAELVDCRFVDCRFGPVDFQGSRFVRCSFVGEVREALFYDKGFNTPQMPPNEMEGCDFSKAKLKMTGFRRLDLATVIGPSGEFSVTIPNYRRFLEVAIREAKPEEKVFRGMMEHYLKWSGPNQRVGYFDKEQLEDYLGPEWQGRIDEIQSKAQSDSRR